MGKFYLSHMNKKKTIRFPLDLDTNLEEIIGIISNNGMGCAYVRSQDDQDLIAGLITVGDLRRALENNESITWNKLTAKDLMTKNPITINDKELAIDAISLMEHNIKKPISVLPVINDLQKMVGILRLHDLVQAGIK